MTGGLKTTGRLAIAAMFCAIGGMPGVGGQAEAADLGGDCCADLEERVAELEATTVRKGNKKVKVELYGRVNRVVNFWDDGAEQNVYVENNSYSSTRFGMRGKAKISDNWSSGFQIEIEDEGNLSKFVNQFNDNVDNGSLNVRKSAIYIENKQLGKVWLGQQETAKDNITKDTVVIKGLDQTMHADFYMNWSFFLRQKGFDTANAFSSSTPRFQDIGRCYSTSSSAFDCSTRRQEIRYDTPEWWGFIASGAWGEDDVWSASLRYQKEWDNWKIGAGYAYEGFTDELVNNGGGGVFFQGFKRDLKEWAGMRLDHPQADRPVRLGRQQQLREQRYRSQRRVYRQRPARHACLGHRRWYQSPVCMERSRSWLVGRDHHLGRLYSGPRWPRRLHADHGLIVAVGYGVVLLGVGRRGLRRRLPWHPVRDRDHELGDHEMVPRRRSGDQFGSDERLHRLSAHRAGDQTGHRDPAFSPTGTLKNVPITLDDFDVLFMGGRIQF